MLKQNTPPGDEQLRVLITGATSGVGEAAATLFAARGARVALLGRRRGELDRVASVIGDTALALAVDITDETSVTEAVAEAARVFGGLDVVVNAAGVASEARLEDLSGGLWRETIDTNLSGIFYVCREAALRMKEQGHGAIVNVASDLAIMGVGGLAHYCASKAGVTGLTRALAIELAPTVRVNAVCPGPIDTPMLRAGLEASDDPARARSEKEATVPLQRLADPAEIARAIYFMAVEATFATGSALSVDGGTSAA